VGWSILLEEKLKKMEMVEIPAGIEKIAHTLTGEGESAANHDSKQETRLPEQKAGRKVRARNERPYLAEKKGHGVWKEPTTPSKCVSRIWYKKRQQWSRTGAGEGPVDEAKQVNFPGCSIN